MSDNGSIRISAHYNQFAQEHNIKMTYSSGSMPQADGDAEGRVNIAINIVQQKDMFTALRKMIIWKAQGVPQ